MIRQFFIQIVFTLLTALQTFGQTHTKSKRTEWDTTFSVFGDKNYFITFKTLPTQDNEDPHFRTLTLIHDLNGQITVLLQDTLEFFIPLLQLKDFNNDNTKDVLILNTSSARSVWTHHLYLVDNTHLQLIRVKEFEEINNPEFDSKNNIIASTSLYNKTLYSFFRISKDNKLIDLGNSFEGDMTDTDNKKYKDAIKNILKNNK